MSVSATPSIEDPGAGSSPRRQETRRRLVEAATGLFAEEGVHRVTSKGIARRAGVATGTFYLHFPDKHALFEAIVFDALGQLRARQDAAVAAQPAGADELVARVEELVAFTEDHRDLIRVVFERGAEHAEIAERIVDQVARDIERRLARGIEAGRLPATLHPGAVAQARAAGLTRVIAWWAHDPSRASRDEVVATLLHLEPGRLLRGAARTAR